jgi:hypothetical protein
MASLKDRPLSAEKTRSAKAKSASDVKAARADQGDGAEAIETGSVEKPTCQGAHIAYQATKEYLKNFGPKPPDQPGELGPCKPSGP